VFQRAPLAIGNGTYRKGSKKRAPKTEKAFTTTTEIAPMPIRRRISSTFLADREKTPHAPR
jgi:hypothetical protein